LDEQLAIARVISKLYLIDVSDSTSLHPTGALEPATFVRRAVSALGRRLRAQRPESDLSLTKLSVLGHLFRRGSMTSADLAALERVQPQSLTRVLAELLKAGFVSRRADTQDARRLLLDITGEGRAMLSRDMQLRDAWLARAMNEELSATERELLRLAGQLMERLANAS
jgi:DNA-binding MarR family transcriptional regulator